MKNVGVFTILFLFWGFSQIITQENFYYGRNGKKVPLEISPDKISIQFNVKITKNEAVQILNSYAQFDSISALTAAPGWFVTGLKNPDASKTKSLTNILKTRNEINNVQPVYLS